MRFETINVSRFTFNDGWQKEKGLIPDGIRPFRFKPARLDAAHEMRHVILIDGSTHD